jgi:hypothetical protein
VSNGVLPFTPNMKHEHSVVVHYSTASPNPSSLRIPANASSIDCPRPPFSDSSPRWIPRIASARSTTESSSSYAYASCTTTPGCP